MLSLKLYQKLVLRLELKISGGWSETCFPKTEDKLNQTIYQKSLRFVGGYKRAKYYRSVMDMLFGECFPEWRFNLMRFYAGKGERLIDDPMMTDEQILAMDEIMCNVILEVAKIALQESWEKEWRTWENFYDNVQKLLKVA